MLELSGMAIEDTQLSAIASKANRLIEIVTAHHVDWVMPMTWPTA